MRHISRHDTYQLELCYLRIRSRLIRSKTNKVLWMVVGKLKICYRDRKDSNICIWNYWQLTCLLYCNEVTQFVSSSRL